MSVRGPLFFVDVEAFGNVPSMGKMTEFGIVVWPTKETFHGVLIESRPSDENPAVPVATGRSHDEALVARNCAAWLDSVTAGRKIMVSDNPAFDFMWIADLFWRTVGSCPFGHSARRISDFYAGLVGDWHNTQAWKYLRVTTHDHHPVHDALGNVEAFDRILAGERGRRLTPSSSLAAPPRAGADR